MVFSTEGTRELTIFRKEGDLWNLAQNKNKNQQTNKKITRSLVHCGAAGTSRTLWLAFKNTYIWFLQQGKSYKLLGRFTIVERKNILYKEQLLCGSYETHFLSIPLFLLRRIIYRRIWVTKALFPKHVTPFHTHSSTWSAFAGSYEQIGEILPL